MKRRLLTIAIFVVAGAAVNVAVAWGVAAKGPVASRVRSPPTKLSTQQATAFFDRVAPEEWPDVTSSTSDRHVLKAFGSTQIGLNAFSKPPQPNKKYALYEVRHGLPFESLRAVALIPPHFADRRVVGGWTPVDHDETLIIPFRPLWFGFTVNTLCYGAILWLLVFITFVLHRILRVRRGLCPTCAYPSGESAVCSECGKPLPQHPVA